MIKIIFLIFVFVSYCNSNVFSQNQDYFEEHINNSVFNLIGNVKHKNIYSVKFQRFDNEIDLKNYLANPDILNPDEPGEIDFSKYTLLLCPINGVDCHSKFKFEYEVNDELKSAFIKKTVIYGGCRAGGRRFNKWVLIPKLNEDYKIIYMSKMEDDLHGKYTDYEIISVN
ncbi:MAG TPA: hypothetical protein PLG90_09525 [Ignavibacteria bacterium]|nr:hypothetical protein [Ignavibacteria bacterium]